MKLTISKEDYLKAIAEAESEEGSVIASTIVRWLGVSAPAVTLAIRRLRRDKLIEVNKRGGAITLTSAGREISDRLRQRHHLIERMLAEMLGMEWYKVHEEAERLEHAVSEDFERAVVARLGASGPCPHGNQIDKSAEQRRRAGLRLLSEAIPGERVQVNSVYERDRKLLEYLDGLGIRPDTEIEVLENGLRVAGTEVRVEQAAARRVWVREL